MIALDTSVVLRHLLKDDPVQSRLATELVGSLTAERPGFLSREVIVELFWVLEKTIRLPRAHIVETFKAMLGLEIWRIETPERFISALVQYENGGAGFADQMIRLAGLAEGCVHLATFDARLASEKGVTLLA